MKKLIPKVLTDICCFVCTSANFANVNNNGNCNNNNASNANGVRPCDYYHIIHPYVDEISKVINENNNKG